jgi:2-polyprenyl-3-methyl-5-hydroxy-6-metoxy-1,4-benzoquinol methylase
MEAPIYRFLKHKGFISSTNNSLYIGATRDNQVHAFRDTLSNIIYIDPTAKPCDTTYYSNKKIESQDFPRNEIDHADTVRRSKQLLRLIPGKKWLDFGCGPGYMLRANHKYASSACGIELNQGNRISLQKLGFQVYENIQEISAFHPQVVSAFHVVEHLDDPVGILKDLFRSSQSGGTLIIEVPHAKDFLLETSCKEFLAHTLWSEHLVLHTRESLRSIVQESGWNVIEIIPIQRYPIWNHIAWLTRGIPTGLTNTLLDSSAEQLEVAYSNFLASRDMTDTLLLFASKP